MGAAAVTVPAVGVAVARVAAATALALLFATANGTPVAAAEAEVAASEGDAQAAQPWGVVRVISETAEVRTGPGFSYRAVYLAPRGETLEAVARGNRDFWFQVKLPDGTYGWILGDQVLALNVDPSAQATPGFFARAGAAIFAPPALLVGDVGLSFSAGLLGGEGAVFFRPSILLAPHLALEGFFGQTSGDQIDRLYFGGNANLFLWPSSPITMFFSLGGGGTRVSKKADQFAYVVDNLATATAGGGLLISFKKRVTLRFDFRNYTIFDPDTILELQEYTGGLAVFF